MVLNAGAFASTGAPFSDEERESDDDDAEDFWADAQKRRARVDPPAGLRPILTLHPEHHFTFPLSPHVAPPTSAGLCVRLRC
ncbi:MAG: hypothetical protein U0835_01490 [Isosphaeraceae bacterium]